MTYHLAIDIGASSGRHILGYIENGKLHLEEIHRFENYITNQNGTLVWDIEHLVNEVKKGIAKCKEIGKIPCTVAIDAWGVDYVLLDESKQEIMPAVSYRDIRSYLKNESMPIEVVVNSVYHSLVQSYKNAIDEIEKLAGKTIDNIFIVGGGSKDTYLNELTAQYTGKKVVTGLSEATATGNLLSQIMFDKKISLAQARELVRNSFDIKEIN